PTRPLQPEAATATPTTPSGRPAPLLFHTATACRPRHVLFLLTSAPTARRPWRALSQPGTPRMCRPKSAPAVQPAAGGPFTATSRTGRRSTR
ncbi:hypothetical protein, partial [Enterobacter hormaechei]|uniref:hypothetical protein n=1 Tax=Enterobacter hormaechei TaxID=158836 RepID=UPI00203C163D